MSRDLLPQHVEQVALAMCEGLSTPVSLGVAMRIKYRCWDELAEMRVHPKHYTDPDKYWADSVCVNFLRKCQDLPTTIDRKAAAVDNFWKSEKQCFRTNQRLTALLSMGSSWSPSEWRIREFILLVRKKVGEILGSCPTLEEGRFGPGATFGDKGQYTLVPDKISSRPTLTHDSWPFLFQWIGNAWARACAEESRDPLFVRGNRFTTVPKDCTKDRGIAVEPSINIFYQLAYGKLMKTRLKSYGIDLVKGQAVHREMACKASCEGTFATVDLSNASDTVSKVLVKTLLPHSWYEHLNMLRSPYTRIDDSRWVLLEKFSSMGNGYTFELETTIFLAIACAVCEMNGITPLPGENVFVYGDDIIVPTAVAQELLSALKYLGFQPNKDKTFISGDFKESCGGDFWGGVDVRPFFLEEYPSEPQHFITIANGLSRMVTGNHNHPDRARRLSSARARVLDAIPTHVRLFGPKDLGDLVIHAPEEKWRFRWRHGIRYIRCYAPVGRKTVPWHCWRSENVLASALYTAGNVVSQQPHSPVGSPSGDAVGVSPRDAVTGYGVTWLPFS